MPTYFRSDGWVKAVTGQAVPGAQVYVATQPANTTFLPPTPAASIFSDPDGLVPITQPILTDGFGHYDFYVLPGTYTVVIGLGGVIQQVYPDQSIGIAGGGGTVTSVGLTADPGNILTVTGSPITDSGDIALSFSTVAANTALMGPTSGPVAVPSFRQPRFADLSSNIAVSQMNSGTGASSSTFWRGDGTWAAAGGSATSLQGVDLSSSTPRTGDTLRYNEYSDSKWDVVNGIPKYYSLYSCLSTITGAQGYTTNLTGAGTTPATVGTQASVLPTATEPVFQNSSKTATGSTSLACAVIWPQQGGPSGSITFGTLRRFQARARLNNISSVRYWVGLVEFASTIATTFLATDTPNGPYAAFRFSAGTDSVIQAVTGTASGALQVQSTGVSVDTTNSQLFEIVYTASAVYFYINGTLVQTNTTNLPTAGTGLIGVVVGDNKNTSTAMSLDFAHMIFTVK